MPGSSKLRLEVVVDRPANVVQEFSNLAGVINKYIIVKPLEEILNCQIGLLFAHSVSCRFQQLAEVADIGRQPGQTVFSYIATHLEVAKARDPQMRHDFDSV